MKNMTSFDTKTHAPMMVGGGFFSATPLGLKLSDVLAAGSPGHKVLAEFILRHPIRFSARTARRWLRRFARRCGRRDAIPA
jgi:hypothetical protein